MQKIIKKFFLRPNLAALGVLSVLECRARSVHTMKVRPFRSVKTEKIVNFQKKSYFLLILKEFWCIINLYVDFTAVGIAAALSK